MFRHVAALAACMVAFCATASAYADAPLTLDDAFRRVLITHPALRVYDARHEALSAHVDQASQRPALRLGAEVENAFAGGGLQNAEWTLSLASVLERGGKREARRALANSEVDALAVEREKKRMDLLAETARRYLDTVAANQRVAIAHRDIEQRRRAVDAARKRHRAGAAPESVLLGAQAALSVAELDLARTQQESAAARRYMAAMWGGQTPDYQVETDGVRSLPALMDFSVLAGWLDRTPELAAFADRKRIGEARLQLARSAASTDIEWQVGIRRLGGENEMGLLAGVSIPLGSARRAEPGRRAARAGLERLAIEHEALEVALRATLAEAYGRYQAARTEVRRLEQEVLPRLARAAAAASRAWGAGAATYMEWSELQSAYVKAGRRQLTAAVEARRALIEIQRLTGQPFVMSAAPESSPERTIRASTPSLLLPEVSS